MEKTPPDRQRIPSFVDEVLNSAEKRETEEIHSKLGTLNDRVDELKLEVYEMVKNKYAQFNPFFTKSDELSRSVEEMSQEMADVSDKIENKIKKQLNTSTEVFQSLKQQLEEKTELLAILEDLVRIEDGLETLASANQVQDFHKAAMAVQALESIFPSVLKNCEDIKIFKALQEEFLVQKEGFVFSLESKWKELVKWRVEDSHLLDKKNYELEICVGENNANQLSEVVMVMEMIGQLGKEVKKFGETLFENFLKPCIIDKETIVSEPQSPILRVTSGSMKAVPPSPLNAFTRVNLILTRLNQKLLNARVDSKSDVTLMSQLGSHISAEVLELLVRECLTKAIPTNTKELESFEDVLNQVTVFNSELVAMNFTRETENALLDFTQNVGTLFANKKCQEILIKARKLMTENTHNTVLVSHEAPIGELPSLAKDGPSNTKARKMELASEFQLSCNTFKLPTCHVSVCVQELMYMAYSMLQEATESSTESAVQIFFSVRKMFEMYSCVYPTYHEKSLIMFPQQSAIFHNDCMYIAHHLMTLGHQFSRKLPSSINVTFVDLVEIIRKLGIQNFLQQLTKQKKVMAEYLQGAKGFANVASEEVQFDAERAVKQTLHQLQHLQKVWHDVMPGNTYRKAIGTLLNSVVVDITGCVVILEDISSDDARQLARLCTMLKDKAGPLVSSKQGEEEVNAAVELQKNVKKWLRFTELIVVLNANLMEISNRWADGKGPLANEFSANEVKLLIRALFQNTERRSAVLLKIK